MLNRTQAPTRLTRSCTLQHFETSKSTTFETVLQQNSGQKFRTPGHLPPLATAASVCSRLHFGLRAKVAKCAGGTLSATISLSVRLALVQHTVVSQTVSKVHCNGTVSLIAFQCTRKSHRLKITNGSNQFHGGCLRVVTMNRNQNRPPFAKGHEIMNIKTLSVCLLGVEETRGALTLLMQLLLRWSFTRLYPPGPTTGAKHSTLRCKLPPFNLTVR